MPSPVLVPALLMGAALTGSLAFAQSAAPDVATLGVQLAQGEKANSEKERSYAFRMYKISRQLDKDGKESERKTETRDIIGLEGSTYRKLILRDDKPLAPAEQKREDARLARETAQRKKETPEQRRNRLFSTSYNLSFRAERMKDLYDLQYVKDDVVDGRPAYVIEGLPKTGLKPADANGKELLNYRVKAWIDQQDHVASRVELEVIGEHSRMQKGTVFEVADMRNEAGVWLTKDVHIRYTLRIYKMVDVRGEVDETYSDYQRFQVDSGIVEP